MRLNASSKSTKHCTEFRVAFHWMRLSDLVHLCNTGRPIPSDVGWRIQKRKTCQAFVSLVLRQARHQILVARVH